MYGVRVPASVGMSTFNSVCWGWFEVEREIWERKKAGGESCLTKQSQ